MGRVGLLKIARHIFFHLLSFDSCQAKTINFGMILFIAVVLPTSKLNYLPVRSIYKEVFGIEPYSVGLTRAMSRLLHGDFAGAMQFNKLVFLVFIVILALFCINAYRWYVYYKKTGNIYSFENMGGR